MKTTKKKEKRREDRFSGPIGLLPDGTLNTAENRAKRLQETLTAKRRRSLAAGLLRRAVSRDHP
jgi:hypothetical protein